MDCRITNDNDYHCVLNKKAKEINIQNEEIQKPWIVFQNNKGNLEIQSINLIKGVKSYEEECIVDNDYFTIN